MGGRSFLNRNFQELSIVYGGSPSPVVEMINMTMGCNGNWRIGYSSKDDILHMSYLLRASLPSSSAAYLAVLVWVPYNTNMSCFYYAFIFIINYYISPVW